MNEPQCCLQCDYYNQSHLEQDDQWDYRKITIHSRNYNKQLRSTLTNYAGTLSKFDLINGRNVRDHSTSGKRSKRAWSDCSTHSIHSYWKPKMATITSLPSTRNTWRLGTQRNDDGDEKKAKGIFSKTTTLHDHAVLYSSLPSLHNYVHLRFLCTYNEL